MEFIIWVETRVAGRTADIQQVASVERPAGIKAPEEIGLSLADGKVVIRDIQRRIVEMQFRVESKLSRLCPNCQSQSHQLHALKTELHASRTFRVFAGVAVKLLVFSERSSAVQPEIVVQDNQIAHWQGGFTGAPRLFHRRTHIVQITRLLGESLAEQTDR